MPFTPSHAAAVLPFLRTPLPASALIAGSVAPLRARVAGVPVGLGVRLSSAARVASTLLALVVGAGTHVLWDEFTHARRWGRLPVAAVRHERAGRAGPAGLGRALVAPGAVVGAAAAVPAGDLGEAIYDAATWGGGTALGVAVLLSAAWRVRHRDR